MEQNGQRRSLVTNVDNYTCDNSNSMEVRELRHQVRLLSAELQQLRTNLSGSSQSLQVQCSDTFASNSSALSSTSGRVSWTPVTNASPNSRNFNADDFKPPLPPRLYRPPAKPQRTFAQNGLSTTLDSVDSGSTWIRAGVSMDCIMTATSNGSSYPHISSSGQYPHSKSNAGPFAHIANCGPSLPPRLRSSNRSNSHQPANPPPPPPKPYKKVGSEERILLMNNTSIFQPQQQNRSSPLVANHNHQPYNGNGSSRSLCKSTLSLSNANHCADDEYSQVRKNSLRNCNSNVFRTTPVSDGNKIKNISHLPEPINEETLVNILNHDFSNGYSWFTVGPVLLYLNSFNDSGKSTTFSSTKRVDRAIVNLIDMVHNDFYYSEMSQAIVLTGERGSGKTSVTMQILRQIFSSFAPRESIYKNEAYRNFAASVDVLTSLTTVKRRNMNNSSHAAFLYELHVADSILTKIKIHYCNLDQSRLCDRCPNEQNFQIFHQILAGLTLDEKKKYHLDGHTVASLNYLNANACHNFNNNSQSVENDKSQFHTWKSSLAILGIPFSDVMRVLASILLLGNVRFVETKEGAEMDLESSKDLEAIAALLGITSSALYKSLTKYTTFIKRQWVKSSRSVQAIYDIRDALAKTLYHRCVSAIIRRANCLKSNIRPGSGISSSDESCAHDSGIGINCQNSDGTINSSQNSVQGADGLISVFDMFGYENEQSNNFEKLCANYANEKVQSFFRMKIFRTGQQIQQAENVENDYESTNILSRLISEQSIDLFLSSKTGIFYLLNEECSSPSGSSSHFHQMLKQYNKNAKNLTFPSDSNASNQLNFVVKHFDSTLSTYSAVDFVNVNRDLLSPDVIKLFNASTCNFGFVTHLFSAELRSEERQYGHANYRITPSSNGADLSSKITTTLCQDFLFQFDTIIKSLTSCKVHFVQCLKANSLGEKNKFDELEMLRQLTHLDTVPLLRLLSSGLPYAVKLKEFNCRYRFLIIKYHRMFLPKAPSLIEETKVILDCYLKAVDDSNLPYVSNHWTLGSQHIFLSEGARDQLDTLRQLERTKAITVLQKFIKKMFRKNFTSIKSNSSSCNSSIRRAPLIESHVNQMPSIATKRQLLERVVNYYGLNVTQTVPPPVPASRKYSVVGNQKNYFHMNMGDVNFDSKRKGIADDVVMPSNFGEQDKCFISKCDSSFLSSHTTKICI